MIEGNSHIPPEYAQVMAIIRAGQIRIGSREEKEPVSGTLHESRFALRFWRWRVTLGDRGVVSEGWHKYFTEYVCPYDRVTEGKYVRVRHSNRVEVGKFAGDSAINPIRLEGKAINRDPLVKRTRLFWKEESVT